MKNKISRKKYHFAAIILVVVILAVAGFVEFSHHSVKAASVSSLNWTESPTLPWGVEPPVVFNSKLWIIGSYGGTPTFSYNSSSHNDVWSSSDGANWTEVTANTPWPARNGVTPVVFNNELWIIGGNGHNDVWSSSDGATWTEVTANAAFPAGSAVAAVSFNGKLWIIDSVSGVGNEIWSSSDGATWTEVSTNGPWSMTFGTGGVGYANNGFFFVFNNEMWGTDSGEHALWYSTDGVNWTATTATVPVPAQSIIVFNNEIWALTYTNGYGVWSTPNGTTWTKVSSNGPSEVANPFAVAFNSDIFVINGGPEYEDVLSSSDGINWTNVGEVAPLPQRYDAAALVYNSKMWLLGGDGSETHSTTTPYYTDVWSSPDGINWNEAIAIAPWGGKAGSSALAFNNEMWLLGGEGANNSNDVWYSSDGVNWTEATASASWPGRDEASALVFNGKMWIMGGETTNSGFYNDVWSSSDGVNWTEATANAPWAARAGASAVVFNNEMWIMGGFATSTNAYNDVWYSSDGANWTKATASAPWPVTYTEGTTWPKGSDQSAVVINGEIWIIDSGSVGGAWYSSDGVNWTKAAGNNPWAGRYGASVLAFNNGLWLMNGTIGSYSSFNDVWSTAITTPTICTGPLTFTFTDPTLTPGVTPIRAVHINELRTDINSLRTNAGLSAYSFTDPTLTPGVTPIRAVHITDLRTALGAVYTTCGQAAPTYTDATITPGSSLIRATDINELRSYVSSAL